MRVVNVHEAKTQFSKLLAAVEKKKHPIVICRNGEPVAQLVPHRHRDRTKPHPTLSRIQIDYDPVEPLSEEEWPTAAK
jgi:prevent-host-death family protein